MQLYIAGKVNKNSQFGTQHWRQGFALKLTEMSGIKLTQLDPLAFEADRVYDPQFVFDKDCWLINQVDCVIVYLSDDISVGCSQEILIAKYLNKPVIGFAPHGGKFNKSHKEHMGQVIENYIDPFVYATCDVVCGSLEEVVEALRSLPIVKPLSMIDEGVSRMSEIFGHVADSAKG